MFTLCRFEPRDTLFFRDNRPATAGDPLRFRFPLPSVTLGALRTHWLCTNHIDSVKYRKGECPIVTEFIGEASSDPVKGRLSHYGPFLWKRERLYFPVPRVLLGGVRRQPFGGNRQWRAVLPRNLPGECWDLQPFRPLLHDRTEDLVGGWLSSQGWEQLLRNGLEVDMGNFLFSEWLPEEEFFELEPRFGHFRDDATRIVRGSAGTATDGPSLYWAEHIRLYRDVAIASIVEVDAEAPQPPFQDGVMGLGGEKRRVELVQESIAPPFASLHEELLAQLDESGRVFCVLITPAVLDVHPTCGVPRPRTLGAEPIAAAVGEPVFFSGWDLAAGRTKALRVAVPAGSVFFYEGVVRSTFEGWIRDYAFKGSLSSHLKMAGFGTALFGIWRN